MSISGRLTRKVTNYGNKKSMVYRLRAKRIVPLLNMMEAVFEEYGSVNIIDIGGTEAYWDIVPQEHFDAYNVTITIVNLPNVDKPEDHGPFKFVEADACDLSRFDDKSFHIAHSNSVVEHVGNWGRMIQYANELSRVSQNYYVQTPNYWFPIEPHSMTPFFAWLPKPIKIWLVLHFQLGNCGKAATVDKAVREAERIQLLNKKMFQELFKEATILTERLLLLPKSFIAIKNEIDA